MPFLKVNSFNAKQETLSNIHVAVLNIENTINKKVKSHRIRETLKASKFFTKLCGNILKLSFSIKIIKWMPLCVSKKKELITIKLEVEIASSLAMTI
jgi:hypothetical protein